MLSWSELRRLDPAVLGWCALAGGLAVVATQLSFVSVGLVGSGPALAVGAMSEAGGLVLAHDIDATDQNGTGRRAKKLGPATHVRRYRVDAGLIEADGSGVTPGGGV